MSVELERKHGDDCPCDRCRGWQPGNEAHLIHGATSERRIRPVAANHRRRVLRQMRTRASDLDPVGRAYLEHYCRLSAKVVLLHNYLDDVGLLDDAGNPRPCMRLYVQLHRAALGALAKLEGHLSVEAPSLEEQLAALRRSA